MSQSEPKGSVLRVAYSRDSDDGFTLKTEKNGEKNGTLDHFIKEAVRDRGYGLVQRKLSTDATELYPHEFHKACLFDIFLGSLDMCIGQFIASDKNLPVLTSKPFFKTQYFLVVRNEIKLNASFLQLQVFSLNGWLMILAAVLYMGFAVDMIYHGCSRKSIKVKPFLNRIGDIIFNSVGHCFMKESAPP